MANIITPPHTPQATIQTPPTTPTKKKQIHNLSPAASPTKSPEGKKARFSPKASPEASPSKWNLNFLNKYWHQFESINSGSQPIEWPQAEITELVRKIREVNPGLERVINPRVMRQIASLAHTLLPNHFIRYKKNTPFTSFETKGDRLPKTFYVASIANRVFASVTTKEKVGGGSGTAVPRIAITLEFSRTEKGVELLKSFQGVKLTQRLTDGKAIERAKNRIFAAGELAGVSHIANPYFHGIYNGAKGQKFTMIFDKFDGDLFSFSACNPPDNLLREANARFAAKRLGAALLASHERGVLHRDMKEENILANWIECEAGLKLLRADIDDYDMCTQLQPENEKLRQLCGTIIYLAPEMRAVAWEMKQIFEALAVEDPFSLIGSALDYYGLGLVLHNLYYGKFPEYIYDMCRYMELMEEGSQVKEIDDIAEKWVKDTLKLIEKQKSEFAIAIPDMKLLIEGLLFIDPRKRFKKEDLARVLEQL